VITLFSVLCSALWLGPLSNFLFSVVVGLLPQVAVVGLQDALKGHVPMALVVLNQNCCDGRYVMCCYLP
jgi:hypothetical protein